MAADWQGCQSVETENLKTEKAEHNRLLLFPAQINFTFIFSFLHVYEKNTIEIKHENFGRKMFENVYPHKVL